ALLHHDLGKISRVQNIGQLAHQPRVDPVGRAVRRGDGGISHGRENLAVTLWRWSGREGPWRPPGRVRSFGRRNRRPPRSRPGRHRSNGGNPPARRGWTNGT